MKNLNTMIKNSKRVFEEEVKTQPPNTNCLYLNEVIFIDLLNDGATNLSLNRDSVNNIMNRGAQYEHTALYKGKRIMTLTENRIHEIKI